AAAERDLVRALDPVDVFVNRPQGSIVRLSGRSGAPADRKLARRGYGDHFTAQLRGVGTEGIPGTVVIRNFHDIGSAGSYSEGTDEAGTNDPGISQSQTVVQV